MLCWDANKKLNPKKYEKYIEYNYFGIEPDDPDEFEEFYKFDVKNNHQIESTIRNIKFTRHKIKFPNIQNPYVLKTNGSLLQIQAYGNQDFYLVGNPTITYFKINYKK